MVPDSRSDRSPEPPAARGDAHDRRGGPFPSDRFTVVDPSQITGRRVSLPKPDCAVRPTDCANLDVINTLDVVPDGGYLVRPSSTALNRSR